jgi:hypothetical protein
MRRLVFLVSSVAVPVEHDATPLHMLAKETPANQHTLAELFAEDAQLLKMYAPMLDALQPQVWKEVTQMARSKRKSEIDEVDWDLRKFIQAAGVAKVIQAMDRDQIANQVAINELVEQIGVEEFLAKLSPSVRQRLKESMK